MSAPVGKPQHNYLVNVALGALVGQVNPILVGHDDPTALTPGFNLSRHLWANLNGALGHVPPDFQLFNFSRHFRAAQTLTFDCMRLPVQ